MEAARAPAHPVQLLDWRRRVADMYATVRTTADPMLAHRQWKAERDHLLRTHSESPVPAAQRDGYVGATVAAYDPAFRFCVNVDVDLAPLHVEFATGTDGTVRFRRIGVVRLGDVGVLDVWWLTQYGGGIFIPIKDKLAGAATYGGGRYIIDTVKGADLGTVDGRLVIDLNFAYNPSCAYDPAWACPLAPAGNVVTVPVLAGELMPASDK